MCNCHSILECCGMFSGIKLSIRSFNLFTVYTVSSVICCEDHLNVVEIVDLIRKD